MSNFVIFSTLPAISPHTQLHRRGQALLAGKQENDLNTLIKLWMSIRKETIAELYSIASENQQVCQNVRKARIAGGTVSAAGAVMGAVGFFLIPVTFGASLALTISGTAIGLAGSGTALGATAVDVFKMYRGKKNANAAIAVDCQLSRAINELNDAINATAFQSDGPAIANSSNVGMATFTSAKTLVAAVRVTDAVRMAAQIAGGVSSMVIAPIEIISVGFNSYRLHNNTPAELVKHIEEHILQLQQELDSIQENIKGKK